jgi:hypothetical protein
VIRPAQAIRDVLDERDKLKKVSVPKQTHELLRDVLNTKTGLCCSGALLEKAVEIERMEKAKKAEAEVNKLALTNKRQEAARGFIEARIHLVQFVREGGDIEKKKRDDLEKAYRGFGGGAASKKAELVAALTPLISAVIARAEVGGAAIGGAELGGADVGGADVGRAEIDGAENGGAEGAEIGDDNDDDEHVENTNNVVDEHNDNDDI